MLLCHNRDLSLNPFNPKSSKPVRRAAAKEAETRKHTMTQSVWSWAGCIQHTQTIFICTFVHLQMYMYIQSTMHQLAKLEIEAATSP